MNIKNSLKKRKDLKIDKNKIVGNLAKKDDEINSFENIPKSKTIKLKDKATISYSYIKVIPDTTIMQEQKTYFIAKTLYSLTSINLDKLVEKKNGSTLKIRESIKVTYIIDMSENSVNFYFLLPTELIDLLKEKIYEVFTNCRIEENIAFELPKNDKNVECNSINLKYNDTFSLNTDNSVYNLEELISNHQWLEDDDRLILLFNFTKLDERTFKSFRCDCFRKLEENVEKYNMLNNKFCGEFIGEKMFEATNNLMETVMNTMVGALGGGDYNDIIKERIRRKRFNPLECVSVFTREKVASEKIFNEMVIVSYSKDNRRKYYNLKCISDSFDALNDENELIAKRTKLPKNIKNLTWGNKKNIMSLDEISKFLILPNKNILEDYQDIEQVKVLQQKTSDFVKNGMFYLGTNDYKGKVDKIYLPKDYNSESLALVLIAPQGGGKTTLMTNLSINAYRANQSNVIIDYIKNCEYSDNVLKHIPDKNRVVIIKAEDLSTLPLIDFNEYDISKFSDPEKIGIAISNKTDATVSIINTLNEDKELTSNMEEIFCHTCQIVYSIPKTTFGDVIDFLLDHEVRMKFIEKAKKIKFNNKVLDKKLNEAINKIDIINEYGKDTDSSGKKINVVVGTNASKINGIMARIMQLKKSFLLYSMVYGDCKAIDFVSLLNEGKTIVVQLPEHCVSQTEKNVISTLITMKTILATKIRGGQQLQPLRTNIWIDEIYQVPTVENVIDKSLSQLRKYGLKVIISVHRMTQLNNKHFYGELLSSGASFTFLAGCQDIQLKDFADRLKDYPSENIYNLAPYHAFHIIHSTNKGDWKGCTALPDDSFK